MVISFDSLIPSIITGIFAGFGTAIGSTIGVMIIQKTLIKSIEKLEKHLLNAK